MNCKPAVADSRALSAHLSLIFRIVHLLGQAPDGWLATPNPATWLRQSSQAGPLRSLTPCSDSLSVVLLFQYNRVGFASANQGNITAYCGFRGGSALLGLRGDGSIPTGLSQ
jgi:hypothetical protein